MDEPTWQSAFVSDTGHIQSVPCLPKTKTEDSPSEYEGNASISTLNHADVATITRWS